MAGSLMSSWSLRALFAWPCLSIFTFHPVSGSPLRSANHRVVKERDSLLHNPVLVAPAQSTLEQAEQDRTWW